MGPRNTATWLTDDSHTDHRSAPCTQHKISTKLVTERAPLCIVSIGKYEVDRAHIRVVGWIIRRRHEGWLLSHAPFRMLPRGKCIPDNAPRTLGQNLVAPGTTLNPYEIA